MVEISNISNLDKGKKKNYNVPCDSIEDARQIVNV